MLEVRPAVSEDLPALTEAFKQPHYFQERIARQPHLGVLFVAEHTDDTATRVAGAAFLRMLPAEEWELREHLRNVPILSHLQVAPQRRRQGVASAIMDAAEDYARAKGRARIALGVTLTNAAARRLYANRQYVEWDFGPVNAMVVEWDEAGRKHFGVERCQIMVKALPAPATAGFGKRPQMRLILA
ncbi:GNAT family N-acetyltransferase [Dactylosporangium sp. NPDC049140]|uniref:GNAT family N-acetyltransferase n=1 Tax=Dactylosporangium sp. NPDC049140 TaxID=3155647 RepID=UPI00340159F9